MMKFIIVSLLLVSTLATSSFLGNTCAQRGQKCGHEMEGQVSCCSGLTCNFGNLPGAPGVCGDNVCSVEGELCGHELAHKPCCSGLTCNVQHQGVPGATGRCQAPVLGINESNFRCGGPGETCGLEFEGGIACCPNHECIYPETTPGSHGVCLEKKPACVGEGQTCSHEMEGNQCCSGYSCTTVPDAPHGAPGVCLPAAEMTFANVCATEGQVCGHELEGNIKCCSGFSCTTVPDAPMGAPGVCLPAVEITEVSICASEGQVCGHELEGNVKCCSGYSCTRVPDAPIGAPGVCLRGGDIGFIAANVCATEGEVCGHELEGNVKCCSGFKCTTIPDAPIGSAGVCLREEDISLEAPACVSEGEICGHELEGSKCCSDLECTAVPDAPRGAPGVCLRPATINFVAAENACAQEGDMCGHELEGSKCCSGLQCTTIPDAPRGASGVCLREATEVFVAAENVCAQEGDICGHELQGDMKCCSGFKCTTVPDAPMGAAGVCLREEAVPVPEKISENLCAVQGEICGHELEGTIKCCSGYSCQTVPDAPIGAPGICFKDVSAELRVVENNTCAVEGESCGHELEGVRNCCEGLVCFLGDVAPLGSTGVCMSQITM